MKRTSKDLALADFETQSISEHERPGSPPQPKRKVKGQ